jgi:multidrug efflux pump subunit AcrA (membrane-fusion protein)
VLRGRKTEAAPITTGMANEMHVEVLEGLAPGDRVVVP